MFDVRAVNRFFTQSPNPYNKFLASDGYSGNMYDITSATKDGVLYPSMDPSCFELKYPATDIEGRVVGSSSGDN